MLLALYAASFSYVISRCFSHFQTFPLRLTHVAGTLIFMKQQREMSEWHVERHVNISSHCPKKPQANMCCNDVSAESESRQHCAMFLHSCHSWRFNLLLNHQMIIQSQKQIENWMLEHTERAVWPPRHKRANNGLRYFAQIWGGNAFIWALV